MYAGVVAVVAGILADVAQYVGFGSSCVGYGPVNIVSAYCVLAPPDVGSGIFVVIVVILGDAVEPEAIFVQAVFIVCFSFVIRFTTKGQAVRNTA